MSERLAVYRFGPTTVEVWEDNVRTLIGAGQPIVAADDDMRACADHELAHTWLAWHYTRKPSATMLKLAGIRPRVRPDVIAHEELIVLAYVRGLEGHERPWDWWHRIDPPETVTWP